MGLRAEYIDYINTNIVDVFGGIEGIRMLELGNQRLHDGCVTESTGKQYYKNRGVEHVSVDINGLDGAVVADLRKTKDFTRWVAHFDVVTNSGTTEHVEPHASQFECFANIHNCLRPGGISIHLVPDADAHDTAGAWRGHCSNLYSPDFFHTLADLNHYNVLSLAHMRGLVCCCVRKMRMGPFTSDRETFLRAIDRR